MDTKQLNSIRSLANARWSWEESKLTNQEVVEILDTITMLVGVVESLNDRITELEKPTELY